MVSSGSARLVVLRALEPSSACGVSPLGGLINGPSVLYHDGEVAVEPVLVGLPTSPARPVLEGCMRECAVWSAHSLVGEALAKANALPFGPSGLLGLDEQTIKTVPGEHCLFPPFSNRIWKALQQVPVVGAAEVEAV